MTVEAFVPSELYTVSGTGPYAITHAYRAAEDIRVSVVMGLDLVPLSAGAFTVTPSGPANGGIVTLTSAAATANAGRTLRIDRATATEQGFVGATSREKGVERQLDAMVMAIQENAERGARALVIQRGNGETPEIPAIDTDHTIIATAAGGFAQGPSKGEIESAADSALAAGASANAAASSAAAAASSATVAEGFSLAAGVASGRPTFPSVADMVEASLDVGIEVETLGYYSPYDGGGARYRIVASSVEPMSFRVTLSDGKIAIMIDHVVSPLQVGYSIDASAMTTPAITAANWARMKGLLADIKISATRRLIQFDQITTPSAIFAEWISGRSAPIGFYSDSTTDGATTTGHVASTGSDSPYGVTMTESPNAYPKVMESLANKVTRLTTSARCYNGGFDGKSFKNGWGLNHWYNTWFRGLAGSNRNWTDVKMIVIGFGTTDSINLNDTGQVIDDFSADLEAVIIDCFLRGVQPAIQGPVLTWQNMGNTVSYRDADESVTIIEAVQKRLEDKYGIPFFSMAEPMQLAVDNWDGHTMRDFIATDGVHPNDTGHRLHAGYLITRMNRNIPRLTAGRDCIDIPPGHPAYVMGNHSDQLFPASLGGLVLKQKQQFTKSNTAYVYEWLDGDGNGKATGEELIRVPIWVEKPCVLVQSCVQNNRAVKPITLESVTLFDTSMNAGNVFDAHAQPVSEFHSHKRTLFFLHHGLNIVYVYASSDGPDQKLGGFQVHDARELGNWTVSRGTGGTTYLTKTKQFPASFEPYLWKTGNRHRRTIADFYNSGDAVFHYVSFELASSLDAGITYSIYTHINDLTNYQEGFNILEISGDTVTIRGKANAAMSLAAALVNTQTISGLNAMMIAGTPIELRFRSRFLTSQGLQVSLLVNGQVMYNHQANIGQMYTDGYGFEAPAILFRNAQIFTQSSLRGLVNIDKLF
ncbi:MAG: SGNH/GDSL hydrolase family protein [Rhodobacterales bacterium]|nr:SGNH/GDSL hydrolase family protein [Rhodobacterales bacterium]